MHNSRSNGRSLTPSASLINAIQQIHDSPTRLVLEFAGAGSLALFWLHSVAGSSRTIIEATDRYASNSLADLLGRKPESFVSEKTAMAMAARAYRRAMYLSDGRNRCLGVSCTAAITTDRTRHGVNHCWIAAQDRSGVSTFGLELAPGMRDRLGEELVVSELILSAIAKACEITGAVQVDLAPDEQIVVVYAAVPDLILELLAGTVRMVTIEPKGEQARPSRTPEAVLSGSFNPLHFGHELMAHVAASFLGRPVTFELPIVNADKAPLGYAEIIKRIGQFRWRSPVVLTRAPLFVQKSKLFPGCVFVIGYDTAVRLIDNRFYDGEAGRNAALDEIRAAGCRFLVAGRLHDGDFRSLRDIDLPPDYQDLFIGLPESMFRVDISSTELRRNLGAGLTEPRV